MLEELVDLRPHFYGFETALLTGLTCYFLCRLRMRQMKVVTSILIGLLPWTFVFLLFATTQLWRYPVEHAGLAIGDFWSARALGEFIVLSAWGCLGALLGRRVYRSLRASGTKPADAK